MFFDALRSVWLGAASGLLDLCYPCACLVCGVRLHPSTGLSFCDACLRDRLAVAQGCCLRCGTTLPPSSSFPCHCCGWCANKAIPLDGCVSAVPYVDEVRRLILRCKHLEGAWLCRPLAELLVHVRGSQLRDWSPDLVLGVPRFYWRRLRTGYDQARALAREVGRLLGLRYRFLRYPVRRVRRTRIHAAMSPSERARNVRKAFRVRAPSVLRDRRVLLVDDVMTSGATLFELGRTLKRAGAVAVFAATIARAGKFTVHAVDRHAVS